MTTYTVAYYNWYDEVIQFAEGIEANSGLEAMKYMDNSSKSMVEEQYCQDILNKNSFIGYMEEN